MRQYIYLLVLTAVSIIVDSYLNQWLGSAGVVLAVTGTGVSQLAEWDVKGGLMQWWTGTVDPGSIAAAAQEIETFTIPGATAGDPVWASLEAPVANLNIQGAKVTGTDVVSVYLGCNYGVTTAVDSTAVVVQMMVLKRAIASS